MYQRKKPRLLPPRPKTIKIPRKKTFWELGQWRQETLILYGVVGFMLLAAILTYIISYVIGKPIL